MQVHVDGNRLRVSGPTPVRGRLRMPGDKSVSHRALILSALADGTSVVHGLSDGEDVRCTRVAIEQFGATVEPLADGAWRIGGRGGQLAEPSGVIDVGNSGTAIRLLAGVAASQAFLTVLTGDASIHRRPMDRIALPLRLMGTHVDGRDGGRLAPLVIRGGSLRGIDYEQPVASAQVKSAVLLAGLTADGETVVREPARSRAHTEEMLEQAGADVEIDAGLCVVRLRPSVLQPQEWLVPGDPSQAAFWVVAAAAIPGSELHIEGLYLGASRAGFLDVLARMGADLDIDHEAGSVVVRSAPLRGTDVTAEEIPGLVDEVPALAVAAALADGPTRFLGAGELRVKESDRLATISSELGRLGAQVEVGEEELVVFGGAGLRGAGTVSHGDHRIAMAMAVAGLAAHGETIVEGMDAVPTSYPGFVADLAAVTG
ncbi:MAG: 3-phosphoshikimate 1-carboxyvinyltransferase [Acidimicrobiia bacterium]|jgi:3-phosphoshikimate 1-carboxyvinyltransferase|nr:3-phosphoshikimate 1-carboxyvinyltransferase [Acidimicrobiia bacterium]